MNKNVFRFINTLSIINKIVKFVKILLQNCLITINKNIYIK